ncbi:bile acid:sodium symporter family protein [Ruminococcus sp.]|uniref:bile acid:sodium symporter family protein n=1 Tax=Ruminococcus sp. TaxID=41978 RepID=UPI0025EAF46E|nr:bile acid:sodium symporter family protein [Ruminococcus sp.]MBQ8966661.1 bile acid:sodium symporter family protein [Ruminococcus sp.]
MKKISEILGKYMAWIVLLIASAALLLPKTCLWIKTEWVTYLLMIVMFGMGTTMKLSDLSIVFKRPRDVAIGCLAQFIVMPLLAFLLGKLFGLDNELLVGVVMVGTCPGGTSSNVMTYLAKGDTALSVGMTSVNTLLAPFLTPMLTYVYLRTTVSVNIMSMFLSIVQVVIIPIALGLLINKLFGNFTQKVSEALPAVSVTAICLIVGSVVSHNSEKILSTGLIILAVVVLHNLLGYLCGYLIGVLFKMDLPRKKALAIEVGMQNSGLATSLAGTAFPDLAMATVPGAVFSVWHNISGAVLAGILNKKEAQPEAEKQV